jgi:single-strand DNA-binding protein
MSNSLNKVQIIGNATADAEVKSTPGWASVSVISIATNRKWKDSSWEAQEDTEFHSVVLWRGLADLAWEYVKKWKKLYIEWYLKTKVWEDPDHIKRYRTEIIAENMIFLNNASNTAHTDEDAPPVRTK